MGKLLVLLTVVVLSTIVGGFLWPYTIESWAIVLNKPVNVEFWQGALIGFCPLIGQVTIPVAVITWILMLFF